VLSLLNPLNLRRIAVIAILLAVPVLLTNCTRLLYSVMNAPSSIGSYERHANIRYGDLSRQSLDVFVPDGARNRPTVVFWYGGIWTKGTKEQYRFVGAALANAGYIAILPDYRLYPGARFPDFVEDGALAVRWAREHVSELGGDPRSIFIMGHSAGAHLAAMLALDERYLKKVGGDASWIRGWIAVSAPYELQMRVPVLKSIFGAHSAAEWQPIQLVSSRAPPALIVHGLDDNMVHPQEAVDMDEKLRAAGVPVACYLYEGNGHVDVILALSVPFRLSAGTLADVRQFVDGTVAGGIGPRPALSAPCNSVKGRKTWGWENPPRPLTTAALSQPPGD
jgi:acetyl esterase/lipase